MAFAKSAVDRFAAVEEPEQAAQSYRRLAQAQINLEGRGAEAREAIENAWQLVADRPPTYTRAWVQAVLAMALRKSDPEQGRQYAQNAISDARAVHALGAEADALVTLGMLDEYEGDPDGAVRHFRAAIDTAMRVEAYSTELRARYFLGLHRYERGELAESVVEFDEAAARAKANGLSWSNYGVEIKVIRALAKYVTGDWDGSESAAETPGIRVSDTVLARLAAASTFVMVGRGHCEEASRLLAELRVHWHRDTEIVILSSFAKIEASLWLGRPEAAAHAVTEVTDWLVKTGWTKLLGGIRLSAWGIAAQVELARKARRERDTAAELAAVAESERLAESAEQLAATSRPWTGTLGVEGIAWLAMVRAELTRLTGPGDVKAWQEAVTAFDYGSVYPQAMARFRLAEAMLGADDKDGAAKELAAVATATAQLGAQPLATAAADLARRGRLTVPGLATPRDHVDPFTPRERAVLSLVALGRTNREVGQELYISEKTVSVHLSRIMAKLGASRRAEAVATAYERGLLEPE